MGMSASQARYLGLIARQNDLEYQGQQINQERSVLSQQVSDLYATLEAMTVPTPPSTSAFTTVEYSGKIGATSYSFDASNVKPGKDGNYIVTVNQKAFGDSLQKNPAIALVDNSSAGSINLVAIATKAEKTTTTTINGQYQDNANGNKYMNPVDKSQVPENGSGYYVKAGNMYRPATDNLTGPYYQLSDTKADGGNAVGPATVEVKEGESKIVSPEDFSKIYIIENGVARKATVNDFDLDQNTGIYRFKTDGTQYMEYSSAGNPYNQKGALENISVNGHGVFELSSAVESGYITEQQKTEYEAAIANSGLTKPDGSPYAGEDFYIYFGDKGDVNFVLKADVNDGNNNAISYSYITNGEYSKPTTYDDCKLTFDPSNGRITELAIPNYDENGKVTSWTTMALEANTKTDEIAYKDAYAKYEYNKLEYDKKQQEINAKTEVIQGMDKKLELKLTRLDNERTQITTEIEAVDKVISDNIESSYKTFA